MTKEKVNEIAMKLIEDELTEIIDIVTRDEKTIIASVCRVSDYIGRAAALREELKNMTEKCNHNGFTVKPDGIHELDPCVYEEVERYQNVTVSILRCKRCGHTEIEWFRQNDTKEVIDD